MLYSSVVSAKAVIHSWPVACGKNDDKRKVKPHKINKVYRQMQIWEAHFPSLWSPDKKNQYCYNAVHLPIFKTSVGIHDAQTASSASAK
jgi:hypothetical protein